MRKIGIIFVIAAAFTILTYPEVFFGFKTSFILWYDYVQEYFLTFILSSFFYHGGIQLWDMHGQMPMAYTYVTFGIFKFQNIVASLLFVLAAPLSDHTGQTFHQMFAWGNLLAHLFLRVAGIYLLLRCLKVDPRIVPPATIMLAVYFSQPAFLWGTYMMSFYPLLMYFMVRFVQEWRWRYLAAYLMMYPIAAGNGLIYVGAMHTGMHFFVISCLIWGLSVQRKPWPLLKQDWVSMPVLIRWGMTAGLMTAALFIVAPYVVLISKELGEVAFGAEESRISQPFNPDFYFKKLELSLASVPRFLSDTFNFIEYGTPMIFLGWMSAVLALIALVFSRQSIKWLFAMVIMFLWLLNHPRDEISLGSIAHWINALTNPFKTLTRSYLVVSYTVLAYALMPLAILGIDAIVKMMRDEGKRSLRWVLVIGIMCIFVALNIRHLPGPVQVYMVFCLCVLSGCMLWTMIRPVRQSRTILAAVLGCFIAVDIALIVLQSRRHLLIDSERKPAVFDSLKDGGLIEYDYQNPVILPWYDYAINSFSFYDELLLWSYRGITSNYYHVTNHALNFLYINGHSPRHAMYKSWYTHQQLMKAYVDKTPKILMRVPTVVKDEGDNFPSIVQRSITRAVAVIDDENALRLPSRIPDNAVPHKEEEIAYHHMEGTVNDWVNAVFYREVKDLIIINFKLPKTFPKYLATTLFSEDNKYLQFIAQRPDGTWARFKPVQGGLVNPYSFDVQHIKQGMVHAAFPKGEYYAGQKFRFIYAVDKNEGVIDVQRASYDDVQLVYRARDKGWAVLHYPYSRKWQIRVDGKPVKYYKANKSFIAFPIQAGDNRIDIQYWPHTILRWLLLISAILTTMGLLVIIWMGLRWEKDK